MSGDSRNVLLVVELVLIIFCSIRLVLSVVIKHIWGLGDSDLEQPLLGTSAMSRRVLAALALVVCLVNW